MRVAATTASLAMCILVSGVTQQSVAQRASIIGPNDVACRKCGIALEHVVSLVQPRDSLGISMGSFVARDTNGRYYIAPTSHAGQIAVYNAAGVFIGSLQVGNHPIMCVRPIAGDSLIVLAGSSLSLVAPSGAVVRTKDLPHNALSFRFVVGKDYVAVNNYSSLLPAFLILDRGFSVVRQFGRESPRDPDELQYQMAVTERGSVWVARSSYRYVLQEVDADGVVLRQILRESEWFKPWSQRDNTSAIPYEARPVPRITSIHYDGRGRLWIAAVVADRRWRPVPSAKRPLSGIIPMSERTKLFDTIVEVIDVSSEKVVASQRFDEIVPQFLDDGSLYGVKEGDGGRMSLEVWRPRMLEK